MVLHVQDAVHLWHVPAQPASQFRLAEALLAHALVEADFHGRERRQNGVGLAARWRRDVLAVVDARGDRLLERMRRAGDGLLAVGPEGGQFGEVGGRRQNGAVIGLRAKSDRRASIQPQVLLDLGDEPASQLLAPAVHRQLAGAVPSPDGEMAAATLVGVKGAALFPQPAAQFTGVHFGLFYTTIVLCSSLLRRRRRDRPLWLLGILLVVATHPHCLPPMLPAHTPRCK